MKDQEWWDHQQYTQSENIAPKTRNTSQENLRNYIIYIKKKENHRVCYELIKTIPLE
jgi:hypothetical protein